MRLWLWLPEVRPDEYAVKIRRYKCVRCGRRFRVHRPGGRHHRSQRLRGIGVMLYVLGLSYGEVAAALAAYGWAGSKSSVCRDVQAAREAAARAFAGPYPRNCYCVKLCPQITHRCSIRQPTVTWEDSSLANFNPAHKAVLAASIRCIAAQQEGSLA